MPYRFTYTQNGQICSPFLDADTPDEAGSDAARYLQGGATSVQIEKVGERPAIAVEDDGHTPWCDEGGCHPRCPKAGEA